MRIAMMILAGALGACGQTTAPAAPSAPAAPTAAASSAWDRDLLDLLPQIDACMALSPQTRQVTFAGEHSSAVLVRLRGDSDVDCRVVNDVAAIAPRDAALQVEGEGAAIFVRGPGENPGGECYAAPEVHDAHGALVGWMLDPEGC